MGKSKKDPLKPLKDVVGGQRKIAKSRSTGRNVRRGINSVLDEIEGSYDGLMKNYRAPEKINFYKLLAVFLAGSIASSIPLILWIRELIQQTNVAG